MSTKKPDNKGNDIGLSKLEIELFNNLVSNLYIALNLMMIENYSQTSYSTIATRVLQDCIKCFMALGQAHTKNSVINQLRMMKYLSTAVMDMHGYNNWLEPKSLIDYQANLTKATNAAVKMYNDTQHPAFAEIFLIEAMTQKSLRKNALAKAALKKAYDILYGKNLKTDEHYTADYITELRIMIDQLNSALI